MSTPVFEEPPGAGNPNLMDLLSCATADQLRAAWLDLTQNERRALRSSRALAQHAWNLIIRDRILRKASA